MLIERLALGNLAMINWVMVFFPSLGLTFASQDKDLLCRQKSESKTQPMNTEMTGAERWLDITKELAQIISFFYSQRTGTSHRSWGLLPGDVIILSSPLVMRQRENWGRGEVQCNSEPSRKTWLRKKC